MDSPPKVDLLEFRTQTEVDLDFALTELSDNQNLSDERRIFLRREISRLQIDFHKLRNDNVFLNGGEIIDLTLPVTTPPAKKRVRKYEFDERSLRKEEKNEPHQELLLDKVDSDSETTCPWSDESGESKQQIDSPNGFSFDIELCRSCSAKIVTEDSKTGKEFRTCPYSALRDKKDVKIRDGKGKVMYDKSHTFYWTGRK